MGRDTRNWQQVALGSAPFCLESITAVAAPDGAAGRDWHRYVITQGSNEIVGHRQGTGTAVRAAVEAMVDSLNQRRAGKPGRVHLTGITRPSR
ncbi:MAG TPA: hypothetical protein VLT59_13535 [Steroidobacteraceae bacterium]|nr:hypothetical protein [Steroidobacteraceae bacterium]